MRSKTSIWTVVIGSLSFISSAVATELTSAEIKKLVTGNTLYIETRPESVTKTLYYVPDGTVLFKTWMGDVRHGTWTVKDNAICTYFIVAQSKNVNPCSKYDKRGDTIDLIDSSSSTGAVRAKILKTAPGNAENLKP